MHDKSGNEPSKLRQKSVFNEPSDTYIRAMYSYISAVLGFFQEWKIVLLI